MKNTFLFIMLLAGITLFANKNSAMASDLSAAGTAEWVYKTTFGNLTLRVSGNAATGTYESGNGKLQGVLNGNRLSGTWTNSASRKSGKFEFVFSSDFSSFTGKYGYNDSAPKSNWSGTKISGPSSSAGNVPSVKDKPVETMSANTKIAGSYSTDYRNLTLTVSGTKVMGTYESGNGKLEGVLTGNTLSGTWTNSASKKSGKFVFVFSSDFSSFTGKYGYNNSAPSSRWNGKKTGSSGSTATSTSTQTSLPINVIGSWATNGKRTGRGGLNIWQNGNHFEVIVAWIDEENNLWKSYRGEGEFEGREMNFKVFPSSVNGKSVDQGYVYHYKISPDNNEITGYYTRYGKRTSDIKFQYNRIK
jgi:hypothetical protein